ncbi:SusC/RagA family TonB-linked outer membrane protein [Lacibacter sp. H407]|uniref:SusC/RagA family TonB-linked outer membrane protein n=1 Tax=Lacibacter sp. H407 TaxID=3133423 RepID=UPI0030BD87EC
MKKGLLAALGRLLPALTLLLSLSASAQERTSNVTGIVRSENGEPLANVTVVAKNNSTNLTSGTQTDSSGIFKFSKLPVSGRYSFIFSSIGYEPQTLSGYALKEDATTSIIIKLKDSTALLSDIVVIGYGTQKRQQMSTAVSTVKMNTVDQGAGYNPVKMLQGRASGINITSASGIPGARPVVLIRGVGSISGNSAPLFVVDGVPNEGGYPNINPNDIESMEVLKDASAASIYGSRANSGVVLITTKAGAIGKTVVEFEARQGFGVIANDITMANSTEYANVMQVAVDNYNAQRGTSLVYYRPLASEIEETDWTKVVQRSNAKTSNYNLSVSGGNEKTTYFTSFGAFKQEGILKTSEFNQYSYRIKLNHKLNRILQFNTNLAFTLADRDLIEEENSGLKVLRTAREEQPWYSPYTASGDYKVNGTQLIRHNPLMLINEEKWNSKRYEGIGLISLDVKPFKGFKYTPSVKVFASYYDEKKTLTEKMVARAQSAGWGAIAQNKDTRLRYVIDNLFQYNNQVGDLDYSILAGHSFERFSSEDFGVLSDNYANGAFPSSSFGLINAGPNIYANGFGYTAFGLESYISRLNLSYQGKYMLNASMRIDGASKFSQDKRYGTFPSVSAAWLIHKEAFMEKQQLFDELKLRASYGVTGSISGVGNFASRSLVTSGTNSYNGQSGFSLSQIGQPITWEKAQQTNVGIDASILNNRLSFSVDVFQQRTSDLLYNKPVQATSGYTTIASNIGVMENSGIEFSAFGKILTKKFKWDFGGNISFVKNKVVSLIDNTNFLIVPSSGSNLYGGQMHALITGQPVSTWFIYEQTGIYQTDADVPTALFAKGVRAGDVIYRDVNKDGDITDADRLNVGKSIPDFFGGFTSNLSYGGFELSLFGQFAVGNKVMAAWRGVNGTEGTDHLGNAFSNTRLLNGTTVEQFFGIRKEVALNYWNGPGTSNTTPRPVRRGVHTGYGSAGYNFLTSTRFLENASYFKLKTATLSYNIPTTTLKLKSIAGIRVFASVDNFITLTKYSGYDPEQTFESSPGDSNYGVDFGLQATLRTFLFGVNIKF